MRVALSPTNFSTAYYCNGGIESLTEIIKKDLGAEDVERCGAGIVIVMPKAKPTGNKVDDGVDNFRLGERQMVAIEKWVADRAFRIVSEDNLKKWAADAVARRKDLFGI